MQKEKHKNEIVQRFKASYFPFESDDTDGTVWRANNNTVALIDNEATYFGYVELSEFTESDYLETTEVADRRTYAFTTGSYETYVDVEYVREIANGLFEVSYDTIRKHAYTVPNAEIGNMPKGVSPVMLDLPDNEYRIVIAPVKESE